MKRKKKKTNCKNILLKIEDKCIWKWPKIKKNKIEEKILKNIKKKNHQQL